MHRWLHGHLCTDSWLKIMMISSLAYGRNGTLKISVERLNYAYSALLRYLGSDQNRYNHRDENALSLYDVEFVHG